MSKFKVGDKALVKSRLTDEVFEGVIVSINDFRPPEARYALDIVGFYDLVFLGNGDLEELK